MRDSMTTENMKRKHASQWPTRKPRKSAGQTRICHNNEKERIECTEKVESEFMLMAQIFAFNGNF